ncbi:MAG TPA: aspartate aminotransferase family protein [Gammaproteobacteria bacterium]|jgi:glutamate-1-semialdehyde 2,1-aminomutase|nr:aspartate aminotransferase family protein [Gammaproteobacteria bacterium]|tara:strand:+ start:2493 stop:3758 length:1266 start_codon:yes stop_codon:yes gene_type:complete
MSQEQLLKRASQVMPASGFGNFDPSIIIREGKGSRVWDEDGNEFIDYLTGSGPMILGHGHPEVLDAVSEQMAKGMTFFAHNARGIELAEEICRALPCAEQVRYTCTGSEADMYAMRLARAYTQRDTILKFEGGYHGMSAEAQMSLAPERQVNFPVAVADSAGIPESVRNDMLVAPYNDIDFAHSIMEEMSGKIAAVIVEPFQRVIPPEPGFLKALREACDEHGSVLIFDEVVTGFRFSYGGAQSVYGVTPDVCTLGKIIGGGFPLAAIAGKTELMAHFDKEKVGSERFLMQLGTLSGNPLAAVAGLKTLEILRRPGQYEKLYETGKTLMKGIDECLRSTEHAAQVIGHPTLFDVVFREEAIRNYRDVRSGDRDKAARFNATLQANGILKVPGKFYISLALTDTDIEQTLAAVQLAAQQLTH